MSLTAIALVSSILVADRSPEAMPDVYQRLITAYTEVLLVGHACQPYGASAHPYVVKQTIDDLTYLGLRPEEAQDMVTGLIASEGKKTQAIIKDEASLNEHAAVFYCSSGYKDKLSALDALRGLAGLE